MRGEARSQRRTQQQFDATRSRLDSESEWNLDSLPGFRIAEKLDSARRGLALLDVPKKKRGKGRRAVAVSAPAERWRCAAEDCGYIGSRDAIERHALKGRDHIFRDRWVG